MSFKYLLFDGDNKCCNGIFESFSKMLEAIKSNHPDKKYYYQIWEENKFQETPYIYSSTEIAKDIVDRNYNLKVNKI